MPGSVVKNADGTLHTRYDRTYQGLPVLGGDLVVHTTPAGATAGVTKATGARINPPTTVPARTAASARKYALAEAGKQGTRGAVADRAPRAVVWAADGRPVLAWETVIRGTKPDGTPSEVHVVTDAVTGAELSRRDAVHGGSGETRAVAGDSRGAGPARGDTARGGTGDTLYSGRVPLGSTRNGTGYGLVDTARGSHKTYITDKWDAHGTLSTDPDNSWGTGAAGDPQTAAADAAHGARVTWDYFRKVHNRSGARNDGDGGSTRIHAPGWPDRGASWSEACFCATFGAGSALHKPFTSPDLVVHQHVQGIITNTAKLTHPVESMGLASATGDIFAAAAEFHAGNAADPGDYLVGEAVHLNGDPAPLRVMDRPARYAGFNNYWYPGISGGWDPAGVSAPALHWFHLASEGSGAKTVNGVAYDSPTVDGLPVRPIGRAAAARIWYRALTVYMTSTTDYAGARAATLRAAVDLHGGNSAVHRNTREAWGAVNVGTRSGEPSPPVPPGPVFENTTDVPIPDGDLGLKASSPIEVTGVSGHASSLLKVDIDVQYHEWVAPKVALVAPDGTEYPIRYWGPRAYSVDASSELANGTWRLTAQEYGPEVPGRYINGWKLSF